MEPPRGLGGDWRGERMATAVINRRQWSDNNLANLTDAGPRFITGRLEMENAFLLGRKKYPYSADQACLFP